MPLHGYTRHNARTSYIHESMRTALDEVPKGGRIVFISRNDPPAEMARLRANQTLINRYAELNVQHVIVVLNPNTRESIEAFAPVLESL